MKQITGEVCIKLMKKKFPDFLFHWESFIKDFGADTGLHIQMLPFGEYTIDVVRSSNEQKIKKVFDFIEFLLCEGNEDVQTAITTTYLEYLMSKDPDEIQFSSFAKYLGKNSLEYCRAWDKFTGHRTKGLWDDQP